MNFAAVYRIEAALLVALMAGLAGASSAAATQAAPESRVPEMPAAGHVRAEQSTSLTITVNGVSQQLSPAELAAMPQTTVRVRNAHTNVDESYTGVLVSDLLAKAGLTLTPKTQGQILRSYLRAQGTDFYFVLYSGAELQSMLHDATVIVALHRNNADLGEDGRFKLIATSEKKPARWVRSLVSLTLITVN